MNAKTDYYRGRTLRRWQQQQHVLLHAEQLHLNEEARQQTIGEATPAQLLLVLPVAFLCVGRGRPLFFFFPLKNPITLTHPLHTRSLAKED